MSRFFRLKIGKTSPNRSFPIILEDLESRTLLSVGLSDRVLVVCGTAGDDRIVVTRADNAVVIDDGSNSNASFPIALIDRIVLNGLRGNDYLRIVDQVFIPSDLLGGPGDDTLTGGWGDDTLDGGAGADRMRGTRGKDTVDYSKRTGDLHVDADGGVPIYRGVPDDDIGVGDDGEANEGDTVWRDIETLIGGSGSDWLAGSEHGNLIIGNGGDDQIYGWHGTDTLDGGLGADLMDGGGYGNDVADYSSRTESIKADVDEDHGDDGEHGEGDTLVHIAKLFGGDGADVLGGGDWTLKIFGRGGNDVIRGGSADETLYGGAGDDTIRGGGGDDVLGGGRGDDLLQSRGSDSGVDRLRGGNGIDAADMDLPPRDRAFDQRRDIELVDNLPVSEFQMEFRYFGEQAQKWRAEFERSAVAWSNIILGDLPDERTDIGLVDDIVIDVHVADIDGAGNRLAMGAPTHLREASMLPARGTIIIDAKDFGRITWLRPTVLDHEIAHCLGFGSLWQELNLVKGSTSDNPRFVGPHAVKAYSRIIGRPVASVPLEAEGTDGSSVSHWRESLMQQEIMSPRADQENHLTVLTTASMADLGYVVNPTMGRTYRGFKDEESI